MDKFADTGISCLSIKNLNRGIIKLPCQHLHSRENNLFNFIGSDSFKVFPQFQQFFHPAVQLALCTSKSVFMSL